MFNNIFSLLVIDMANLLFVQPVEMADGLRAEGKIYVVVAILTVILLSLFIYLFRVERKLKDLENKK